MQQTSRDLVFIGSRLLARLGQRHVQPDKEGTHDGLRKADAVCNCDISVCVPGCMPPAALTEEAAASSHFRVILLPSMNPERMRATRPKHHLSSNEYLQISEMTFPFFCTENSSSTFFSIFDNILTNSL